MEVIKADLLTWTMVERGIYIFIDTYTAYSVAGILFVCCRAVEDKNIGPLVKTIMTRCIHCTRCIR